MNINWGDNLLVKDYSCSNSFMMLISNSAILVLKLHKRTLFLIHIGQNFIYEITQQGNRENVRKVNIMFHCYPQA